MDLADEFRFIEQMDPSAMAKLQRLRDDDIVPYPYKFDVSHAPDELRDNFQSLVDSGEIVMTASRVVAYRTAGNRLIFLDLAPTASQIRKNKQIQIMVQRASVDSSSWTVVENLSIGDWIGVAGQCVFTRAGEPTVKANSITMLSKVLRPVPMPKIFSSDGGSKEVYTITDQDLLARMPELDMLTRHKVDILVARSKVLNAVRNTLVNEYGCIEIETPYLNPFFGGAEARPFSTHLNALDQEVFLAISPEIELKRAIVGGIGSGGGLGKGAFFIARNFRNEGVDRTHNPEFTSMEVYIPFVDYHFMMEVTERIFANACLAIHSSYQCQIGEHLLDFGKPWPRHEMTRLVYENSGIDVATWTVERIRAEIRQRGLDRHNTIDPATTGDSQAEYNNILSILERTKIAPLYGDLSIFTAPELAQLALRHKLHKGIDMSQDWDFFVLDLFDIYCEPLLKQPCHVILHPAKSTVLCKGYRGGVLPNGQGLIERFESFALGMELSNAYSELNDPVIQRRLVEEQAASRDAGKEDAMPHNESFLQSIEMGLPPCGGLGIGIDRMMMLLTGSRTIREVIAFPMAR